MLLWLLVYRSKEDGTQTMYTGRSHPARSTDKPTSSINKVDSVCEVVKSAVEKVDANR